MNLKIAALLVFVLAAAPAFAQCPCVPLHERWIVVACETWNCAASALVEANGSKLLFSIPTTSLDFEWVVIRRIPSGGYAESPDLPFTVEEFDGMPAAYSRYVSVDSTLKPLLLTAPDGKILVLSRKQAEPKRRAVTHR